jgi:CheY-like chemotaxis protein
MSQSRFVDLSQKLKEAPSSEDFAGILLPYLAERTESRYALWRCAAPRRAGWLYCGDSGRLFRLERDDLAVVHILAGLPGNKRESDVVPLLRGRRLDPRLLLRRSSLAGEELFLVAGCETAYTEREHACFEDDATLAILALDARTAWQMESRRIVLGEQINAAFLSLDLGMEDLSASGRGNADSERVREQLVLLRAHVEALLCASCVRDLSPMLLSLGDSLARLDALGQAWRNLLGREWSCTFASFPKERFLSQGAAFLLTGLVEYCFCEMNAPAVACMATLEEGELEVAFEVLSSGEVTPGPLRSLLNRQIEMYAESCNITHTSGGLFWKLRLPLFVSGKQRIGRAEERATPPTVLVVDDSLVNRKLLEGILQRWGCDVLCARDGEEALGFLERNSVDLVLMDVFMPVLGGYGATREIRRRGITVPVVALTAGGAGGALEALEAGMDDYAMKPVTPQLLRDILAQWTGFVVEEDGEVEDMGRLVAAVFREELPQIREGLLGALEGGDAKIIGLWANRLKGAAAQAGRIEEFQIALALEEAAGNGKPLDVFFDRVRSLSVPPV